MKRMVDDKEIREFDERITALEQGGAGGTTYSSGEFIYVDNQEKTINLDYTNSGTIEFDTYEGRLWPKVIFDEGLNAGPNGLYVDLSNLNQPVTTNNYNGYSVNYTYGANTYTSKFSYEALNLAVPNYAANYGTTGINYYLDQFNDQHYPTININAGQPGQNAITHINIPHNPTAGTTADYTLLAKDSDGNVTETLYVANLSSVQGEDTDNKGKIYLGSGLRTGSVRLESGGEESSASILVRGTSAVGSEGLIELRGETTVYTDNRINVINSSNTEEVAYLTDITNYTAGSNITFTANGSGGYDINSTVAATINSLSNYTITITFDGTASCSYKYVFKDVPNYDTTPTDISAIRLIPNYAPIVDTTNHKVGFLEQNNTWVTIYWSDGTTTHVDFTSSPTANIA